MKFLSFAVLDDSAVGLKERGSTIKFEVSDTGKGFTEAEAKTLFVRFSQLGKGELAGGTGLGLAISMALVELHGGKMDAKGIPGKGANVYFPRWSARFPRKKLAILYLMGLNDRPSLPPLHQSSWHPVP